MTDGPAFTTWLRSEAITRHAAVGEGQGAQLANALAEMALQGDGGEAMLAAGSEGLGRAAAFIGLGRTLPGATFAAEVGGTLARRFDPAGDALAAQRLTTAWRRLSMGIVDEANRLSRGSPDRLIEVLGKAAAAGAMAERPGRSQGDQALMTQTLMQAVLEAGAPSGPTLAGLVEGGGDETIVQAVADLDVSTIEPTAGPERPQFQPPPVRAPIEPRRRDRVSPN